jgi:RES domain-containing protein
MLSPRWQNEPLSGAGAARNGGRWNPKGTPALYLSADHGTAIAEYMQGLVRPGTLTPYDLALGDILDLTDPLIRTRLGMDGKFLQLPWRAIRDIERREPECWTFARQAQAAGFAGLKVESAVARGVNLVLWDWLGGDRIRVVDPAGELRRPS